MKMKAKLFCVTFLLCIGTGCATSYSRLSTQALPPDPADNLPGIRITDAEMSFSLFRDEPDAEVATAAAGDLAKAYRILADTVGVSAAEVNWAQVAFSRDPNYQPPRHQDTTRWTILLQPEGALGQRGQQDLYSLVPHEQVHAIQEDFGQLPRWYAEGMATWAGLKATSAFRPHLEAEKRAELSRERLAVTEPLRLIAWGGIVPKPEAIMRQITAEQRQRMAAEPGYMPPGPFSFNADDLVSDESNTAARYAASLALFEAVEAKAGSDGVRAWIAEVAKLPDPKKSSEIVRLAKDVAGVDLSGMLD